MFFDKLSVGLVAGIIITLVGIGSCGGGGGTTGSGAVSDLSDKISESDTSQNETVNGEVVSGYCAKDKDCNDDIDCTADACLSGNCSHVPDNTKCDSGQVCDIAKGGCTKAKSCFKNEDCKDFVECTVEGCDQNTHLCQYIYDDSRCPEDYICFPPSYIANSEIDEKNDEYSGCLSTKHCKEDKDCIPDESSCAVGKCVANICVYSPNNTVCDDGNVCNGQESCEVVGGEYSDACYMYKCPFGVCYFPEYCDKYECAFSETPLICDDKNHCTDDACDPENGCVFVNNSKSCEDGEICTENDKCSDGGCVGGPSADCDDKNPCTNDYCKSGASPCQYDSQQDALVCNSQDSGPGAPGCNYKIDPAMDGKSCDMPCIKDGICSSGDCVEGTPVDCDDKNPCTQDWCDSLKSCMNKLSAEPCDPKWECISEVDCDDGIACTEDLCENHVCNHEVNDSLCNGVFCETKEYCDSQKGCQVNMSDLCNDNLVCTTDMCDVETGECQHTIIQCPKDEVCNYLGECQDSGCGDMSGLQSGAAWPMFGFCPTHHHRSPFIGPEIGIVKWTFPIKTVGSNNIQSSPAIGVDGTIYIGSDDGLHAINKSDWAMNWTLKIENYSPIQSSPAIGADGTIYVGSLDKHLYAINSDGTLKWAFYANNDFRSSPAIGVDGTIYVGEENLYAVNADGTEKWAQAYDIMISSPAIGIDGTIYVSDKGNLYKDNNGKLYAFNPDGIQKWVWVFETDGISPSPAIGVDGTIYIGADKFYAFNPDGSQKWMAELGFTSDPAIGVDGTIYVGAVSFDDGYGLYAINPNGTTKWIFKTKPNFFVSSSPAIDANGTIFVGSSMMFGSSEGDFYAINPDGTQKWVIEATGKITSPAIGADGMIYAGSMDGNLYAIGQ